MPHLVERDHDDFALHRRLGKPTRFIAHPVQYRDVADAKNARYGTKTHVAHGIEQNGQSLHRWRLAAWRRHGEIAATGMAKITLEATHDSIFPVVRRATALAANFTHGGPLFRSPPRAYD